MLKILRFPEVRVLTGLSRASIWRYERAGNFPKRRRIGAHLVGWISHEVNEWIESRPAVDTDNSASTSEGQ